MSLSTIKQSHCPPSVRSDLLSFATDFNALSSIDMSDSRGRFIRIEHHATTNGSGAVTKDVTDKFKNDLTDFKTFLNMESYIITMLNKLFIKIKIGIRKKIPADEVASKSY